MGASSFESGKNKDKVKTMFNNIAGRYDFFNHFFSLGIDRKWRKKSIQKFHDTTGIVLDVATGTADMAIHLCKRNKSIKIKGIDISENMLNIGKEKVKRHNFNDRVELLKADSENIPFPDNFFDGAMVAFGVRNFSDLEKGLFEIHRVIKPSGLFVVLEFSKPDNSIIKFIYSFYFNKIMPLAAGLFSKDKKAYKYLPATVKTFPEKNDFVFLLEKAGFNNCVYSPQTFGISTIYTCIKK